MKLPDLTDLDLAGVHAWKGDAAALAAAAATTGLGYRSVDIGKAGTKSELLATLAAGLALPAHFGGNWDALADCLEDDDWLAARGGVIAVLHSAAFRKAHPNDWATCEEVLGEAADYWRERHRPFWVFVG